jgi:hypothetical protein
VNTPLPKGVDTLNHQRIRKGERFRRRFRNRVIGTPPPKLRPRLNKRRWWR